MYKLKTGEIFEIQAFNDVLCSQKENTNTANNAKSIMSR